MSIIDGVKKKTLVIISAIHSSSSIKFKVTGKRKRKKKLTTINVIHSVMIWSVHMLSPAHFTACFAKHAFDGLPQHISSSS